MPRTTKATTTAEALEHHVAADSGLEELPNFDLPGQQNGHSPEGVRPSEQCRTPSQLGIGCTFEVFHVGPHSWRPALHEFVASADNHTLCDNCASTLGKDWHIQPSATPDELAQLRQQDEAEQPALPGTPEPVENEYTVPTEASFGKAKLMPAHGLRAIGDRLIADDDDLEHLRGVEMRYAWRRRGGTQGGNPRFARIKRPSEWEEYLTGGAASFLVSLSADHIREHHFTERQIEAALHEQLSRTERDEDDHDAFRINGPDFSGSISTLDKFGAWKPELREMHAHVAKLPLEQAIEDADESEDDDADDA